MLSLGQPSLRSRPATIVMLSIQPASENALIIYFADKISPALPAKIKQTCDLIEQTMPELLIDFVPAYTSLLVVYNVALINYAQCKNKIEQALAMIETSKGLAETSVLKIPVCYDETFGFDLADLAKTRGLSIAEVIALHSQREYLIYAVGFAPAFAYLGEVDERIAMPRLARPRINIPAGSVGIADNQTAVYPVTTAAGWRIIGRSPLDLSLANKDNLKRFAIGNKIKFYPVNRADYAWI